MQVEDGASGRKRGGGKAVRRRGWRICGSDAAAGWAAETGRTLHVMFHSDDQLNERDANQPDIGAWIRFARKYITHKQLRQMVYRLYYLFIYLSQNAAHNTYIMSHLHTDKAG